LPTHTKKEEGPNNSQSEGIIVEQQELEKGILILQKADLLAG
jgi:hypothetical protein